VKENNKIKNWLSAFRLRTLPLSLSCILLGSFLAYSNKPFSLLVLILAILTTLFLQILSNLANDYGDSEKGTDNETRIGPERAIQSGSISFAQMKKAIYIFGTLSLVSGISLIYFGMSGLTLQYYIGFFVLGLLAIWAAVKYTVGENAYGYRGLGDVFVFLFFGLTGVMGTYFMHTHRFDLDVLLPASAVGFLSVGVLNLNNMRDRISDQASGKNTLAVKFGFKGSKVYHTIILSAALISICLFTMMNYHSPLQLLFLIAFPLIIHNMISVIKIAEPKQYDPLLKKLAMSTLLFVLTFGIGLVVVSG